MSGVGVAAPPEPREDPAPATTAVAGSGGAEASATISRRLIRGSSLLLGGRLFGLGGRFVIHLLIARTLSTTDFGAWAYALSVASFLTGCADLSLNRVVSRFTSIYHHREDHARLAGTIVLVVATVLLISAVFIAAVHAFPEAIGGLVRQEQRPLALLLLLVFLVPLESLDALFIALFAAFGKPRMIFLRRYLLTPVIQLAVVTLMIARDAGVVFLAWGYLAGTLLGTAISASLLFGVLRREGLLRAFRPTRILVPARELFSFSLPLVTSDAVVMANKSAGTLFLGYYFGMDEVALFQVVMPLALLNLVVMQSFGLLYVPSSSRYFADGDIDGINALYWKTAVWITVLSFPVFAVLFAASTPLTVLFYGSRYEASGIILSILVVGQYVQASQGFNGATLKVVGKIRYLVVINLAAALAAVLLTVALVPRFGAVGAALALSGAVIFHNALKQVGLDRATGCGWWSAEARRTYLLILLGIGALLGLRLVAAGNAAILLGGAVAVSVALLAATRETLMIGDAFPELRRFRFLRRIVA